MHTALIILGVILAIPVLILAIGFFGLLGAESRGENPFM